MESTYVWLVRPLKIIVDVMVCLLMLSVISNCMHDDAFDVGVNVGHHIMRRSLPTGSAVPNISYQCNTSSLPQPTEEYPAILFKDLNYNNCTTSGFYIKIRADHYHTWCKNDNLARKRTMRFASMLVLPGRNVTFKACCPSGLQWFKMVSTIGSTPDLNHTVFYTQGLSGNKGIWYTSWLHWDTSFFLKVEAQTNISYASGGCGACYFGSCGLTGKCECAPGYSGSSCENRPSTLRYPSQEYPLVVFPETNFVGTAVRVKPDEFQVFAANVRYAREISYKSLRVLYNRTLTFARNIVFPTNFYNGNDIEDIEEFMRANSATADKIWFNYETSIEAQFSVKVDGNVRCNNCSSTHGVCYTGFCNCMAGYTGSNCDTSL